ncbi:MAG: hypothetical protein ARM1_0671 [Candidatus Micrarchaeota archaeon]|nr:MAG: hypothetical protein ARM1_0671 [Candidatus Micrarchaeota archaeon]
MNKDFAKLIPLIFIIFAFSISNAQIGEIAGPLNFNVTLGHKESLNWTIINQGNSTLYYVASLDYISNITNTTTPAVSIYPSNGYISPRSYINIRVTVQAPNDYRDVGKEWEGILIAKIINNVTYNATYVSIGYGVAKQFSITISKPQSLIAPLVVLIAAILIIAYIAYMIVHHAHKRRETYEEERYLKKHELRNMLNIKEPGYSSIKVSKRAVKGKSKSKRSRSRKASKRKR